MEEKEGSGMMSRRRRRRPNEESNFKIAFCGYNPMKRDLGLKWYAIKVLDLESRHCHSSSSARKKEKENFDINPN
jgi:hypothetical protein